MEQVFLKKKKLFKVMKTITNNWIQYMGSIKTP